ncbi:uncharacterized protein LOC134826699 isoform X2 [Bolinopsis microptera]|uniref:uncharacterized protein LOC134826699 isoform X2 n=1 Tax=Bolinopsis microptera TaxID=2820187 RepID=UPI0030790AFA
MSTEVIAPTPTDLNESKGSEKTAQAKLVIREGHLRVEQVSAAELKTNDVDSIIKLNTSNISTASETQTAPVPPAAPLDLLTLMGGFEECSSWLLSYTASTNQYCRNENDVYNKIKREFSVFTEKEDVLKELRGIADKMPLLEYDEEGTDKMYRTAHSIRYLMDSCVTLHFFMKGSGGVERVIKEHHKSWYEDESWEALNLPYDCFQRILKGKVHKAMNGAIAGKYSNWPGVKEFAQRHTYGANGHQIKFTELYRMMKKDFAAPHDIIRHMRMEDVLEYAITTVPGLKLVGQNEERKVVTDSDVIDLVMKLKHLQLSGVKSISKEFTSFHPSCRDWTSYHMTYQKLNQHFRNVLNPGNRRRSKSAPQEETKTEISSTVLDSSNKIRHSYLAIGINTAVEKKSRSRSEDADRHVTYNERGEQSRSRTNSEREDNSNSVVYLNTDKRSVVPVVGLPGTGKTATLATLLGRAHNKNTPSTVLIISSSCSTTNKLLEFTSGTVLRACPAINGKTKKRTISKTFIKEDDNAEFSSDDEEAVKTASADNESTEFEKVEEPRHSPIEVIEKPDAPLEEIEKPYSPTDSVEKVESFNGIDGEALEDGEIEEEDKKVKTGGFFSQIFESLTLYYNIFKDVLAAKFSKDGKVEGKVEEKKPRKEKRSTEPKIEDEFEKTELPWMVYDSVKDVLNSESQGMITVLHYPNYEDMDAEIICGALEQFTSISSKYPKYLIIDNQDVLTHPCNSNTLDKLVEDHRENNMSVWVAGTSPNSLPINLLDYSTLAILHQFTSKYWYTELADHLAVNSVTYQQCQGLSPGKCIMVAPGANMNHPVHSSSYCYPCTIVPPKPFK